MWDAVSGDEVLTLAHKHIVKTVTFTEVNAQLNNRSNRSNTWYFSYKSFLYIWYLKLHFNILFCLKDSNCLLTGGNDKLLRIYDLSDPEAGK